MSGCTQVRAGQALRTHRIVRGQRLELVGGGHERQAGLAGNLETSMPMSFTHTNACAAALRTSAANALSKPSNALRPVPTAVPPIASAYTHFIEACAPTTTLVGLRTL